MPRQVTRKFVEQTDASVTSATRTRIIVDSIDPDQTREDTSVNYSFNSASTPVKQVANIQVAHLEPVKSKLSSIETQARESELNSSGLQDKSHSSSKENITTNITEQTDKSSTCISSPAHAERVLADITTKSNDNRLVANRSLELESAILGMEQVRLESFVDDASTMNTAEEHSSQIIEEKPKERLVITNLVLNNFKSYAGRQDIGPFNSVSIPLFAIRLTTLTDTCFLL